MLLGVPLTLFVVGCDENDALTVESATTLDVEPDSVTLVKGDSAQMKAVPQDSRGDAVQGYEIIWASENDTIATVGADGTVVAQNVGSTTIIATAEKGDLDSLSGQSSVTGERTPVGSLRVSASTSGDDLDSDGYSIVVDDSTAKDIGPDGLATFSRLSEGNHTVELSGVMANCSVGGTNPRTVHMVADSTVSTAFDVNCTATTSVLEVGASTSGDNQDPDGYTATVDGSTSKDLDPSGTATFSGLSEGDHSVELSGIKSNCSVDGQNPRTVTVEAGNTASTSFSVSCTATTGSLEVSASTSGDDQDSDGYTVTVDGSSSKDIGPNGSATFSGLSEGDHDVELTGLKSNCSVDGSNPKTVSVTAGNTASTSFSVTCSTTAGVLEVNASTSGEDQDSDGYTVTVDGSSSKSIGPNGSATFSELEEGDHQVELSGIKSNCSVDGSNPKTVSVTAGNTVSTSFSVSCTATTGSLDVRASTSGDDQDSDGYTVTVDGSSSKDIGPNGLATFSDLSAGDHFVELTGIKSNCSADGSNPKTVSITAGNTVTTSFSVSCAAQEEVELYDVFEIQVTNDKSYSNPFDFNEIELQATFTAPSGQTIDFFGFYAGDGNGGQTGNVWKLRFMPDEVGTWTYSYSWTDGTPGGSGSFEVIDTGLPGPLSIADDNSWYFETARGNPFHFRGYDLHVTAPESPTHSIVSDIGWLKDLIQNRVIDKGYNFTMWDGFISRTSDDPSTWNESWWLNETDTDRLNVSAFHAYEEALRLTKNNEVYVINFAGMIHQSDVYPVPEMKPFLKYWVARFAPFYNYFGWSPTWEWRDIWGYGEVDQIMGYMHDIDPWNNLLTAHDRSHDAFSEWLGFTMRQDQTRNVFDGNSRSDGKGGGAGTFTDRPVIGSEDIWEICGGNNGSPRNPTEVRRGAWGDMMAGVLPLYSEWAPGEPCDGRGNGDGESEVQRMFDFLYSTTSYRQYQQLNNLVSESDNQIASGIEGQEYLVYDEDGGSITIDLSGTSPSKTFSVLWFNPRNGNEQSDGSVNGGSDITLNSPFSSDTVLLLTVQ